MKNYIDIIIDKFIKINNEDNDKMLLIYGWNTY